MLKFNKLVLWLTLVLAICSCAYKVVELRSIPSFTAWDGILDNKIYNPKDISNTIKKGDIELSISLSNYKTLYRGLNVLGFEVDEEPNSNSNNDKELALILGIKSFDDKSTFRFFGKKIKMVFGGNTNLVAKPTEVYLSTSNPVCEYDYDGKQWGAKSEKIDDYFTLSKLETEKNFECFNIVFDVTSVNSNQLLAIDFSESGLPLNSNVVYFQPKKIKWVRSN